MTTDLLTAKCLPTDHLITDLKTTDLTKTDRMTTDLTTTDLTTTDLMTTDHLTTDVESGIFNDNDSFLLRPLDPQFPHSWFSCNFVGWNRSVAAGALTNFLQSTH